MFFDPSCHPLISEYFLWLLAPFDRLLVTLQTRVYNCRLIHRPMQLAKKSLQLVPACHKTIQPKQRTLQRWSEKSQKDHHGDRGTILQQDRKVGWLGSSLTCRPLCVTSSSGDFAIWALFEGSSESKPSSWDAAQVLPSCCCSDFRTGDGSCPTSRKCASPSGRFSPTGQRRPLCYL
jgi:hypothetical protein